jgi:hypothetical protein
MSDTKPSLKSILEKVREIVDDLRKYSLLAFVVFVALIYGFVIFRINSLGNMQPSDSAVTNQVKAAQIPRVDPAVVKQLESLKDNSVNVQALFDQARSNPFE